MRSYRLKMSLNPYLEKNFESKLKTKSGDNQMSKEVIPSGDMCQADEIIQEACESEEKMAVYDICEQRRSFHQKTLARLKMHRDILPKESMKENLVTEDQSGTVVNGVCCMCCSF